jgi:hypothetical protein
LDGLWLFLAVHRLSYTGLTSTATPVVSGGRRRSVEETRNERV